MHLGLDDMVFALIFIIFNAFLVSIVDGLILKLCFAMWTISVLAFATYIVVTRDTIKICEIQVTCIRCGKRLTEEEYEIDTGNLCEECRGETINSSEGEQ